MRKTHRMVYKPKQLFGSAWGWKIADALRRRHYVPETAVITPQSASFRVEGAEGRVEIIRETSSFSIAITCNYPGDPDAVKLLAAKWELWDDRHNAVVLGKEELRAKIRELKRPMTSHVLFVASKRVPVVALLPLELFLDVCGIVEVVCTNSIKWVFAEQKRSRMLKRVTPYTLQHSRQRVLDLASIALRKACHAELEACTLRQEVLENLLKSVK